MRNGRKKLIEGSGGDRGKGKEGRGEVLLPYVPSSQLYILHHSSSWARPHTCTPYRPQVPLRRWSNGPGRLGSWVAEFGGLRGENEGVEWVDGWMDLGGRVPGSQILGK